MMLKKHSLTTLAAVLALLGSTNVNAGFFDFLSGGDDTKAEQAQAGAANGKAKTTATGKNDKCGDPTQEIFKTRTMSANELVSELRALKGGLNAPNPLQSLNSMFFGANANASAAASAAQKQKAEALAAAAAKKKAATAKTTDECNSLLSTDNIKALGALASASGGGMFGGMASSISDILLDSLISQLSYAAIETFLTQMLDRPDVLSQITVEVPEISSFSPELRKQTLNLAGYLAAIKGSNLMVGSAQKEFDAAKESYKKVMALRESAATALKEALLARQELKAALVTQKARSANLIADADLQYVQEVLDKNPDDFFRNPQVQKVAIAYLKSQPERKSELVDMENAQAEFKGHYGAYGRTAAGAGSMVGFSSLFLKKTKTIIEKQGLAGGAVLVPMLTQGAKEVGALAINVKDVFTVSDEMNEGTFKIEKRGELDKRGISFQRAAGRMDSDATAMLKANLIREDGSGDLSLLYQRARDSATQLADRTISKDSKKKLGEAFNLADPELFSFANALAEKTRIDARTKKEIGKAFQLNIAGNSDAQDAALEAAQKELRENIGKYTNGDARRIIFARSAARKGDAIVAGDYRISIDNIGMEGLNDQMEFLIAESKQGTTRTLEKGDAKARKLGG